MIKLTLILVLTFINHQLLACSCDIGDVSKKFEEHVSIFQGVVTDLIFYKQEDVFGDQYIKIIFDIEKQWKDKPNQNQLHTVYNKSSCYGYWFKEKQRYIIYAFEEGETLNVWWCGGVVSEYGNKKSYKEEIDALNELTK